MKPKKYFRLIRAALTGIFILFAGLPGAGEEYLASDKEDSKNTAQPNNKNESKTEVVIDYAPVPLERLIGMANLIVTGCVSDTREDYFEFQVNKYLLNSYDSEKIVVKKYVPAEIFPPRSVPYKKSQRFVLFLMRPEHDDGDQPWNILGAGEGEMPIEDGFIYFNAYDLKGLAYSAHEVHGVTRNIQRFSLSEFKDAVRRYHECFSWKLEKRIQNKKIRTRWVPSRICSSESVKDYQEKSWIHEYLAKNTMNRIRTDH